MTFFDEVKKYLKVDINDDDTLITSLINAATAYVNSKTGKTLYKSAVIGTDELYNITLKLLIAHWYENRGIQIAKELTSVDHSVDALISHITLSGDYT